MIIISILVLIASILMILIVMVQNSKGGGLDTSNNMVNQIGNVAGTTETVEKFTWYIAGGIAALCLISAFLLNSNKISGNPTNGGAPATTQSETTE